MVTLKKAVAVCAAGAVLAACTGGSDDRAGGLHAENGAVIIAEAFITPFDSLDNIDSPAVFRDIGNAVMVVATAKGTHQLVVYDAATGAIRRRVGGEGAQKGQFNRPNGVLALGDSLLLVVERDNARVQVLRLPTFESLGDFGALELKKPYGLTAIQEEEDAFTVFVSDNYETPDERIPPDTALGQRVRVYRVQVRESKVDAVLQRNLGEVTGEGVLHVVESIHADARHNRLLIAEELEPDSHLKVYDLAGKFSGTLVGKGEFAHQAEGIAMYECTDGEGYWIAADQSDTTNTFLVYDRKSLSRVGAFRGVQTLRTDGVALTQISFGDFPAGAFYASHLDGGLSAFSWKVIADRLGLRADCSRG